MSDASLEGPATERVESKPRPNLLGWSKSPRAIALIALAIAVIAAVAATASWLRPAHDSISFSSEQSAQAKKNVCAAYGTIHRAVGEKTPNPRPEDPLSKISAVTNRQLVLLASGVHLRDVLTAEPAAPAELAKAINSLANTLDHLAINNLARAGKKAQGELWKGFGVEDAQVKRLCA
jgi:hypothetical protein